MSAFHRGSLTPFFPSICSAAPVGLLLQRRFRKMINENAKRPTALFFFPSPLPPLPLPCNRLFENHLRRFFQCLWSTVILLSSSSLLLSDSSSQLVSSRDGESHYGLSTDAARPSLTSYIRPNSIHHGSAGLVLQTGGAAVAVSVSSDLSAMCFFLHLFF